MSREKELVKNTFILGLGQMLPKAISIITLPIVTGMLSKSEFGMYDLISTMVMLILPIATLQIQSAAFRFLLERRENKKEVKNIITNILTVTISVSVVVSIALLFILTYVFITKLLICIYLISDIFFITVSQISRGLSKNIDYSISSVLVSFVNAIGIIVSLFVFSAGLDGVILSMVLANSAGALYLCLRVRIYSYIDFHLLSKKTVLEMLAYSWPMVPNNLSNWVLSLSDRFLITGFCGIESTAIYAAANKIPNLLSMVQSVFTMAWQENASLAVNDKDSKKYYSKMFDKIFTLVFSFTVLLIGYTPIIFYFLIQGDYDEAYIQMPILILAMFFYCMASFQGGIYIAHKKTKSVGITTMIAAAINFLVDIIFIPKFGIVVASISTLVAYLFLYVFRMFDSLRFQKLDYNYKKQLLCLVVIIAMLFICGLNTNITNIANIIISTILFILLNKKLLLNLFLKIKNKKKGENRR